LEYFVKHALKHVAEPLGHSPMHALRSAPSTLDVATTYSSRHLSYVHCKHGEAIPPHSFVHRTEMHAIRGAQSTSPDGYLIWQYGVHALVVPASGNGAGAPPSSGVPFVQLTRHVRNKPHAGFALHVAYVSQQ
jgi:hypothetical protein